MDWTWKAGATALAVALVLLVARRAGRRAAGMAASLPLVTAPALAWIACEQGAPPAASAAIASVSACAALAAFAVVQAWLGRRGAIAGALAGAALVAAPLAGPAALVADHLAPACVFGLAGCALALRVFPRPSAPAAPGRIRPSLLVTASLAGCMSAAAAAAGPQLGAVWAGLLASLPVISAPVAAMAHAAGARDEATEFLRGYVAGLPGRVAFGAAFAVGVTRLGLPAALALAGAAALLANAGVACAWGADAAAAPWDEARGRGLPLPSSLPGVVEKVRRWARSRC